MIENSDVMSSTREGGEGAVLLGRAVLAGEGDGTYDEACEAIRGLLALHQHQSAALDWATVTIDNLAPNGGHDAETLAGLRRVRAALATPSPDASPDTGEGWGEVIRDAIASAIVKADLADERAAQNEMRAASAPDNLGRKWRRYATRDRERAAAFREVGQRLAALATTSSPDASRDSEEKTAQPQEGSH